MTENSIEREGFSHKVVFDPLDVSLGINTRLKLEEIDSKILEVYLRFYRMGWLTEHGNKCFFLSYLLRRILRLHGIEAHTQQVTLYYSNIKRGWTQVIGEASNVTHKGVVDSHCIVTTKNLLLDFSLRDPVFYAFGARAPTALIGTLKDFKNNKEQDFGEMGQGLYVYRNSHRHTKHLIYEQRDAILHFTKQYFDWYRM